MQVMTVAQLWVWWLVPVNYAKSFDYNQMGSGSIPGWNHPVYDSQAYPIGSVYVSFSDEPSQPSQENWSQHSRQSVNPLYNAMNPDSYSHYGHEYYRHNGQYIPAVPSYRYQPNYYYGSGYSQHNLNQLLLTTNLLPVSKTWPVGRDDGHHHIQSNHYPASEGINKYSQGDQGKLHSNDNSRDNEVNKYTVTTPSTTTTTTASTTTMTTTTTTTSTTITTTTMTTTTTTPAYYFYGRRTPVPFFVTTTQSPFDQESSLDEDMEDTFGSFGKKEIPPCYNLTLIQIENGADCENVTEPIVRWRDPMFERLLEQLWADRQGEEAKRWALGDVDIDPLHVDQFIPGGKLDVDQQDEYYSAQLQMWNIQVHGLSTIQFQGVLATRAEDLSDMYMEMTFKFDQLSANGTYSMTGYMGWFQIDSKGAQPFQCEIANATITAKMKMDLARGDRSGCGPDGSVAITDIGLPLNYDAVNFNFTNIGDFYNSVVNGLGIFVIKTNEKLINDALKALIQKDVDSLVC